MGADGPRKDSSTTPKKHLAMPFIKQWVFDRRVAQYRPSKMLMREWPDGEKMKLVVDDSQHLLSLAYRIAATPLRLSGTADAALAKESAEASAGRNGTRCK